MNNNAHLKNEVETLIKELQGISDKAKRQTSRILGKAAKPVTLALFSAAPVGRAPHYRYRKVGLSKRIRASRGKGQRVATYYPGNLANSFNVFRFRNAKYRVTVGAKLAKGSAEGTFGKGGRTDAYYAAMVEKGTAHSSARPFVGPTWNRMKPIVRMWIIQDLQKLIKRIKK